MRWQTIGVAAPVAIGLLLLSCIPAHGQTETAEPNLNFEIDVAPQDEKPDGWVVLVKNGAAFEYKRGSAASGRWCVVLKNAKPEQTSGVGIALGPLIKPNSWYKINYWVLVRGDSVRCGWRLGTSDLTELSGDLGAMEAPTKGDGKWHLRQSPAFKVTQAQVERYPLLAFCLDGPGSVDLDDIRIVRSAPD